MNEECLKECLNGSEMSKAEDKVVEFFNRAEAVQVDEGTWYYHESSVESELKSLYEQLAKANERVSELEKQFETQMTNDFVTTTDQAKRITELEKYNLDLANESHNKSLEIDKANERCAELEKERETGYEVWQAKYQALKDSMSLTTCYECGTRVYELSPRSRCCMCEYGRAQFNERENEQLRKEQER